VQEVTHKLIFAQLLRRATGSVLVLFHAAGADARCATCGLAHDELRDAAAELRAVGAEVPVLSVDCSTPAGTALCAQQVRTTRRELAAGSPGEVVSELDE
jgi:peroxiredoxin